MNIPQGMGPVGIPQAVNTAISVNQNLGTAVTQSIANWAAELPEGAETRSSLRETLQKTGESVGGLLASTGVIIGGLDILRGSLPVIPAVMLGAGIALAILSQTEEKK